MFIIKELTLEITNKCMNKCLHCSSNCSYDNKSLQELSLEKVIELTDRYNPELVNISGGEPLEHKDIFNILDYLKFNKIKHKLYTSLYPLDTIYNGRLHEILRYFRNDEYLQVVMPFHSINNTINDLFMGKEGITGKLKDFIFIVSHKDKIKCSIHIVPTMLNIHTLDETIDFFIKNNIKLLKLVAQGRAEKYKDLEVDEEVLNRELNKLKAKYGEIINMGLPFAEGECIAGIDKLVIMSSGKIIPCESYKSGECRCNRVSL